MSSEDMMGLVTDVHSDERKLLRESHILIYDRGNDGKTNELTNLCDEFLFVTFISKFEDINPAFGSSHEFCANFHSIDCLVIDVDLHIHSIIDELRNSSLNKKLIPIILLYDGSRPDYGPVADINKNPTFKLMKPVLNKEIIHVIERALRSSKMIQNVLEKVHEKKIKYPEKSICQEKLLCPRNRSSNQDSTECVQRNVAVQNSKTSMIDVVREKSTDLQEALLITAKSRSNTQIELICNSLASNKLFKALPKISRLEISKYARYGIFQKNEIVNFQNDDKHILGFILSGSLSSVVSKSDGQKEDIDILTKNECVGIDAAVLLGHASDVKELSSNGNSEPSMFTETYQILEEVEMILIRRVDFFRIRPLNQMCQQELRQKSVILHRSGIVNDWKTRDILQLAAMSKIRVFRPGEVVEWQGGISNHFNILLSGVCNVVWCTDKISKLERQIANITKALDHIKMTYSYHHMLRDSSGCMSLSASRKAVQLLHKASFISLHNEKIETNASSNSVTNQGENSFPCSNHNAEYYPDMTATELQEIALQVEINQCKAELVRLMKEEPSSELKTAHKIATLRESDIFGEQCVLDPECSISRFTITCETRTSCLVVHRHAFQLFDISKDCFDVIYQKSLQFPESTKI